MSKKQKMVLCRNCNTPKMCIRDREWATQKRQMENQQHKENKTRCV